MGPARWVDLLGAFRPAAPSPPSTTPFTPSATASSSPHHHFRDLLAASPRLTASQLLNANNRRPYTTPTADVVVGGGGIIGRIYAIHLKSIAPHLDVAVFEKSASPQHKIGESTLSSFTRFLHTDAVPTDYLPLAIGPRSSACGSTTASPPTTRSTLLATTNSARSRSFVRFLLKDTGRSLGIEDTDGSLAVDSTIHARSVCDASGFACRLTSKLGLKESFDGWNMDVVWGYFKPLECSNDEYERMLDWDDAASASPKAGAGSSRSSRGTTHRTPTCWTCSRTLLIWRSSARRSTKCRPRRNWQRRLTVRSSYITSIGPHRALLPGDPGQVPPARPPHDAAVRAAAGLLRQPHVLRTQAAEFPTTRGGRHQLVRGRQRHGFYKPTALTSSHQRRARQCHRSRRDDRKLPPSRGVRGRLLRRAGAPCDPHATLSIEDGEYLGHRLSEREFDWIVGSGGPVFALFCGDIMPLIEGPCDGTPVPNEVVEKVRAICRRWLDAMVVNNPQPWSAHQRHYDDHLVRVTNKTTWSKGFFYSTRCVGCKYWNTPTLPHACQICGRVRSIKRVTHPFEV